MVSWNLYSDGGSKPNPGKSAYCAALYKGKELMESSGGFIGNSTNNKSEYKAFYKGLKLIEEHCDIDDDIKCYLDSQLVMKQVSGEWSVKDETLLEINEKCKILYETFTNIELIWVKGHSGEPGNEYVDGACTYFIEKSSQHKKKIVNDGDEKIYITVSFSEKDEAKSLGAKWDATKKKWWILSENKDKFSKWIN
jgi:ribonuclease HI